MGKEGGGPRRGRGARVGDGIVQGGAGVVARHVSASRLRVGGQWLACPPAGQLCLQGVNYVFYGKNGQCTNCIY